MTDDRNSPVIRKRPDGSSMKRERTGGRPKKKFTPEELSVLRRRFFEGIAEACPEVLDHLRSAVLPLYQSLHLGPSHLWPETFEDAREGPEAEIRRELGKWADRWNLLPYRSWVFPLALGIVHYWRLNQEETTAPLLPWIHRPESYVGQLLKPPSRVPVTLLVPVPDPVRDESFADYFQRVLKDARERKDKHLAAVEAQLRREWGEAKEAAAEKRNKPNAIVPSDQDPLNYQMLAKYVCLNISPLNSTPLRADKKVALQMDKTVAYRRIRSVADPLGIRIKQPGRPRKVARNLLTS